MIGSFLLGIITTLTVIVFPHTVLYVITCLFITGLWFLALFVILLILLSLANLFKV
jgi:hypothetical protein